MCTPESSEAVEPFRAALVRPGVPEEQATLFQRREPSCVRDIE